MAWGAAACVVLVCYLGYRWRTYDPFDAIASRTVRALEGHDTDALMAMADPAEVADLGLTSARVRVALDATLWRNGRHEGFRLEPPKFHYSNRRRYKLAPLAGTGGPGQLRGTLPIYVQQLGPDKPIVLRLSLLLRAACEARPPAEAAPDGSSCNFRAVALKAGIRGFWSDAGLRYVYPSGERTRVFNDL